MIVCARARRVARLVRGEEGDHVGDVLRLGDLAERGLVLEQLYAVRVASILVHQVALLTEQIVPMGATIPLTKRQLEIVLLIDRGLPNKEIAQRLFIEVPTVKNHVHNILDRLGVHRREDAVSAVKRRSGGLIPR